MGIDNVFVNFLWDDRVDSWVITDGCEEYCRSTVRIYFDNIHFMDENISDEKNHIFVLERDGIESGMLCSSIVSDRLYDILYHFVSEGIVVVKELRGGE